MQSLLDGGEILLVFNNCTQVLLLVVMSLGVGWHKFLHHLHEEMGVEEKLGVTLLELGEELGQAGLVGLANRLSDICHILIHLFCRLKAQLITLGRAGVEFFVFFDGLLFVVVWLFSFFKCVLNLAEKAGYGGERFVGKLLELLLCGIE